MRRARLSARLHRVLRRHAVAAGTLLLAALTLGCDDEAADRAGPHHDAAPADAARADAAPVDAALPDAAPPLLDTYAQRDPIHLRVDDEGLPHIQATNDLDLFYGAGYQQARDVLFHLDYARREATGRTAEIRGPGGLNTDRQSRVFDFLGLARASLRAMGEQRPHDHNLAVAYAAGINRRVEEVLRGDAPRPPEYDAHGLDPTPFSADEMLAIGLRYQFAFSSTLEFDLLYTLLLRLVSAAEDVPVLVPASPAYFMVAFADAPAPSDTPRERAKRARTHLPSLDPQAARPLLATLPARLRAWRRGLDVGEGSNAWSVAGAHTDNGRPILANDSHATLRDPNRMYAWHLDSMTHGDGAFDVIGHSFLGVPGVHVGQNRHVVWGATTNFADQLDLWDVDVEDGRVRLGETWIDLDERDETIRVRQPDGTFTEETVRRRAVPGVGVLLPDALLPVPRALVARGQLLVGWRGFFVPSTDLFTFLDFNRAATLDAFAAAARLQRTGMQTWHAASADGHLLIAHGEVPDRGPAATRPPANRVLDGRDPGTLWTGQLLPDDQLPFARDRPFLASANNDPWGFGHDGDPTNDRFYYGSWFAPGYRAGRLHEALPAQIAAGPVTRAATEALQMEVRSVLAERWRPLLDAALTDLSAARGAPPGEADPALAPLLDRDDLDALIAAGRYLLDTWDGQMGRDAREATLFRRWLSELAHRTVADDLNLLFSAVDEAQPVTMTKITLLTHERDLSSLLDGDRRVLQIEALGAALAHHQASGEPIWGDVHFATFSNPLREPDLLSTPGDDSTLNVAQSRCWSDGAPTARCESEAGAVYRRVTTFDEDGRPVTRANWPRGNFGADADWVDGVFRPLYARPEEIEAHLAETQVLSPPER